jgi:hypothetical protein
MTETVLAGLEAEEGQFDEWDPANVAPVVAWLAGDDAGDITGQVFVIFANHLYLLSGWDVAGRVDVEGRFTIDQLSAERDRLFGGRSPGLPPMGFGE